MIVTVAFTGAVPVTLTVAGTEHVGALPVPLNCTVQARLIVPVKPLVGEMVTVPVCAVPGFATVMPPLGPVRLKPGAVLLVPDTVRVAVALALL